MTKAREVLDFGDGKYEGETLDGMMHGFGTATWESGDTYTGEWRNDVFHGRGTYCWADGDKYVGEYQDEKQHGEGTLYDSTGVYAGHWENDVREGFGKQTYKNGDVYEGEWKSDMKHGKGKQVYANGTMFEGEWFRDMYHGVGMTRNSQGDVYEGEFMYNKPHGRGTYRWADGASYVGYFRDGVKHGEGCERMANGNWVAGNWVNGEHDKMQPIHKVDPGQLAEHQKLLEETLARLNLSTLQPLPVEKLKTQSQQRAASPSSEENDSKTPSPSQTQVAQPAPPNPAATQPTPSATQQQSAAAQPNTHPAPTPAAPSTISVKEKGYSEKDFEGWQPMKMLGKGSFGAVYEAGLRSGKIVCVKIVELGSIANPDDMTKLRNEISLMRRLHHPNIVQYYGCVEDKAKNTLNIFMEYVTGGSLNHYIKKFQVIPQVTVRQWAYQIVCGVKYLHECGIVHRDIKGDNILVTMDGIVKLADFGCSKAIDDVCSKTHGCQTMVGTPYWMAPEVIKCEGYGVKSDVWSVGCTIVEMITGKPPWPECTSMWAAVYKIANSSGLPTEIPKDLDPQMMDFLEKCFERDPNKRSGADELLAHPWLQFE